MKKLPLQEYLKQKAILQKELLTKGPSEELYFKVLQLKQMAPIEDTTDIKKYKGE